MSIDNRTAALLMRMMPQHQRDDLIAKAGSKVVDLREAFSRERKERIA